MKKIKIFTAVIAISSIYSLSMLNALAGQHPPSENSVALLSGTPAAPEDGVDAVSPEPKFMVLPDKISSMSDQLSEQNPVHYYGFVAQRGQDVLLKVLAGAKPERQRLKVEYFIKGEWRLLTAEKQVLKDLKPGAEVIVRVSPIRAGDVPSNPYHLAFGSYPVLASYDLHDEPSVVRIPVGKTEPQWLATQAYKEARLEVKFTDTTGAPLEGAVVSFLLKFDNKDRPVKSLVLESDREGFVSRVINFGRCAGGVQAGDFVEKHTGFNTWRSYYELGAYNISNALVQMIGEPPHVFYLGHICKQSLVRTVPPRN